MFPAIKGILKTTKSAETEISWGELVKPHDVYNFFIFVLEFWRENARNNNFLYIFDKNLVTHRLIPENMKHLWCFTIHSFWIYLQYVQLMYATHALQRGHRRQVFSARALYYLPISFHFNSLKIFSIFLFSFNLFSFFVDSFSFIFCNLNSFS